MTFDVGFIISKNDDFEKVRAIGRLLILALILDLDMTAGMTDIGAFIVMFVAVISIFLLSKWYHFATFGLKHIVLPLCCYIVLAIIPTIYNYVADSIFASLLTLGINIIPVVVIFLVNYFTELHSRED